MTIQVNNLFLLFFFNEMILLLRFLQLNCTMVTGVPLLLSSEQGKKFTSMKPLNVQRDDWVTRKYLNFQRPSPDFIC